MRPRLKPAQWVAMRQMYESGWITFGRLGGVADRSAATITSHARREGWKPASPRSGLRRAAQGEPDQSAGEADEGLAPADWPQESPETSLEDLHQRYAAMLLRQLNRILRLAENGVLDKPRIDALISIGRVFERSVALAERQAVEDQEKRDDETAAVLKRINDRIIHLARNLAARMVAEKLGSGGDGTAQGRLDQ
jgi:hypothetical protein